jgi:hypothetical protein
MKILFNLPHYSGIFNVAFSWNLNHWIGVGRYMQDQRYEKDQCHKCNVKCRHVHYGRFIAMSSNVRKKRFSPNPLPRDVWCTNTGETRWAFLMNKRYLYGTTNGVCNNSILRSAIRDTKSQQITLQSRYVNFLVEFPFDATSKPIIVNYNRYIEPHTKTAKNFVFFSIDQRAFAIVSFNPHSVYSLNTSSGRITPLYSHIHAYDFPGKHVRLSSGTVFLNATHMLIAGHTALGGFGGFRMSFFYVARAAPPFDILCVTPEIRWNLSSHLEYLMHIEKHDEYIYISIGVDDCKTVLFQLNVRNILHKCQ